MKKFILLSMLSAWATVMFAQRIYFVSPNGTGGGNAWADACSLQHAVQHAHASDEIWAMAGYYYGNLVINANITIRGGFAGTENSLQDRVPLTTMDINTVFPTNCFSILDATGSGHSVVSVDCDRFVMDRFTLTGGNTNFGGGLYMLGHTYLHLKDMHVYKNIAQNEGGGLYIEEVDSVRIENIVVCSNSALSRGGGIYFVHSSDMLLLINALIVGNRADNFGGGIVFENTTARVINATIADNHANVEGGAISLDQSTLNLYNTILYHNVWGSPVYIRTPPCTVNYNHCDTSENDVFINGPGRDYRLSGPNPCVNSGIWPSGFPFNTISTDLDHNVRHNGGMVDIGAYELQ